MTSSTVWRRLKLGIFKDDLSALDLGEVENIVDQGQQGAPAVLGDFDVMALVRSQVCLQQQLDHANDAVHGGADFVAHVGQEAALGAIGGLGAFAGVDQLGLVAFSFGDFLGDAGDANQFARLDRERERRGRESISPARPG